MWKAGMIAGYLFILSILDIREQRISVRWLAAGAILTGVGVTLDFWSGGRDWLWLIWGSVPGLLLLLVAWLSRKAGYADGVIVLCLGLLCGYRQALLILALSLFLISMASICLLMLHRVKRNTKIPYLPFLTVGFLAVIFLK